MFFFFLIMAIIWIESERKPKPFEDLFQKVGSAFGISPNLLKAIARKESNFNPAAISGFNLNGTRDYGLMQLNSVNLSKFGLNPKSALNAEANLTAAAKLLNAMKKELGNKYDIYKLIASYNQGVPRTLKYGIKNVAYTSEVYLYFSIYGGGNV